MTKYLFKTLVFSQENLQNKLELKWMAEYQEFFGVTFVIDRLILPESKDKFYYFFTICMSPPAGYYKSEVFDMELCKKIDLNNSKSN